MSDQTIHSILAEATSLFAEKGVETTTIQDIAKNANISQGIIIYHFKTKENLFFIVSRNILYNLTKHTKDLMIKNDDPVAMVSAFIDGFFSFAESYPLEMKILARSNPFLKLHTNKFPMADLSMIYNQYSNLLKDALDFGVENAQINNLDTDILTEIILSLFQGLCHLIALGKDVGSTCAEVKKMVTCRLSIH